MCGEKAQRARGLNLILGSPPHVRGKEDRRTHTHKTHGITPACAGKSRIHRVCTDRHRDHPRMCGEKDFKSAHPSQQLGSPPRMRGKVLQWCREDFFSGITPAYAGKSSFLSGCTRIPRDHPRVCGEKNATISRSVRFTGSPPRMRGKATVADVPAKSVGITPAYAGKSGFLLFAWSLLRDHPRVCGEKALCTPYGCFTPGSPPRMRGKVVLLGREAL